MVDHLSQLPIDLFIQQITYLPFDDVISVCSSNKKLHSYCNDPKYNNKWKSLIDNTFGNIYNYKDKLKEIWDELNLGGNTYNYLVYTKLVKVLDPITQLMIYYRQGDMSSFNGSEYDNTDRFLAMFLMNRKDLIENYLPYDYFESQAYQPYVAMLYNGKISQDDLNDMLIPMIDAGNIKGIALILSKGADIHHDNDLPLRKAIKNGDLDIVKYLVEHGANIHANNNYPIQLAEHHEHTEIIEYLRKQG